MKIITTLIANAELQVLDRVGRNLVESTQLYGYGLLVVSGEQGRGKKMETTIVCWGYIHIRLYTYPLLVGNMGTCCLFNLKEKYSRTPYESPNKMGDRAKSSAKSDYHLKHENPKPFMKRPCKPLKAHMCS